MPQIVKADTDCLQPLTQQDRYYCGYNAGSQQAQDCQNHHTSSYCAGFDAGYAASWSASQPTPQPQNLSTSQPTPTENTTPQPQQCGLGKTIGSGGLCHYSVSGVLEACINHFAICSALGHLLLG